MAYVEALTGTDIDFGKVLWRALRGNKIFPADGALWLSQSDSDSWHLLVATPRVDEIGPRKAYEELSKITQRLSANSEQLSRIELISPRQPLYQALRSVFGKTASVEGARLGNTQIGGRYINDAYLYEIR
ncbi:MAG: hypothetical protein WCC04_06890 [Terriglobales bacterium]